jgi:hypothetical protein
MVERIHIDPATFAVTLFGEAGHALSRERLSEAEKQIFAISILLGLARASADPLPAIIDTPIARLDSAHRRHPVERYFPHASDQVVIRSTDTEVDVEMSWHVFAGDAHEIYLALLKEQCVADGLGVSDEVLARQLRLHLHRGISYLATPHTIRSIGDLVELAAEGMNTDLKARDRKFPERESNTGKS